MLKFLLITIIFIYVVYKASNLAIKLFYPIEHARRMQAEFARKNGFGPKYRRGQQYKYSQSPSEGRINVDYVPQSEKKERTSQHFKGGEYVDYEEIK